MKKLIFTLVLMSSVLAVNARSLIVYYSYTNNVERIVTELRSQIDAGVVEIEPAEKGLDYAADTYAIGSALISAIRTAPDNPDSYPAIDPVNVNLDEYDTIIIGAPLWWSNMAAPMQTFLFHNGARMAGKNIGMIVSSASSGISGVESDARRLIPDGKFLSPSLWIKSSRTSNAPTLIEAWLESIDYRNIAQHNMHNKLNLYVNGHSLSATLVDNSSTRALMDLLSQGAVTIHMTDYGNMEKVGPLPAALPRNDEPTDTRAGDLILYQGRNFVIYYDTNSWNFTRLGKIDNISSGAMLKSILGNGDADVTLSITPASAIDIVAQAPHNPGRSVYNLRGEKIEPGDSGISSLGPGVYIIDGQKIRID